MDWYIPITLLPGIALLILSTSNFIIALNAEVQKLKANEALFGEIIALKIKQLKRLSKAISGLYLSVLFFTISGLFASISYPQNIVFLFLLLGIVIMSVSVLLLITYSILAIKIKTKHLRINPF